MNRSFETLLFDMDGLMLDTERLSCAATYRAAEATGIAVDEALLHGMIGLSEARCTAYLAERLGSAERAATLQRASRQTYRQMLENEDIALKPGIVELLEWAEERGIPRAVATSTRREIADLKLSRSGLGRFFEHTVAGDEVERTKPAPDLYLAAAARLQAAPQRAIVLEDSMVGMRAGLAAGARVLLIPDLIAPSAEEAEQALAVCRDLRQALALLREL
ncbi:hydrolase [Xenophilus sp. AP218F]|nr:hydrolase [Xenophilus sp. AP218F]